jgi:hypothetical protein
LYPASLTGPPVVYSHRAAILLMQNAKPKALPPNQMQWVGRAASTR